MPEAFYVRRGEHLAATALTRGPWDNAFQHGGPPCALLAGALERAGDDAADFFLARIHFDFLRPVPLAELRVELGTSHRGRSVQRLEAELVAEGTPVLRARALRIRRAPLEVPSAAAPPVWPEPESLAAFHFDFFRHEQGYHRAVEVRLAYGTWGRTPVGFWARPRVPLVAGRPSSTLEALVVLADAQSGMGPPLDPSRFSFVNPDLSVFLEREPAAGWLGFDIRSSVGGQGSGVAQSALRDACGELGRSAQTLVVAPR